MHSDGSSDEERTGSADGKRRRISKACDACNSKHDRCDGGEPCRKCQGRNLVCSYSRLRIGPGPRRGWLEQLKARFITVEASLMAAMDDILNRVAPGAFKCGPIPDRSTCKPRDVIDGVLENLEITVAVFREEARKARATVKRSPPTSTSSSSPPQNIAHPQLRASTDAGLFRSALVPWTSSAPADVASPWEEGSPTTASATAHSPTSPFRHDGLDSSLSKLLQPVDIFADLPPLPPPETINSYVLQFFDYNWKFRFTRTINAIHRPTFLATFTKQSPLLLYSVLIIGSYSSAENPVMSRRAAETLFSRCTRILQDIPENVADDVSFIQALLLLCQHTTGFERSLARQFMSLATTTSRQLMLLTDPSMSPDHQFREELPGSAGWIKEEERRRTGWCLFGSDRIGSFLNNTPPLISDEELKLRPPASDELWGSNPSSSAVSALLRYPFASPSSSIGPLEPLYIIGQARTLCNRNWSTEHPVVTEFERILRLWYKVFSEDSIPDLTPTNARALLLYNSAFVALHSPRDCLDLDPTWVASASYHKALEHAFEVRHLLQRFQGCGIFLSPFPLTCMYQCALIWLCHAACGGTSSITDVKTAIQELTYYSPWWPEATRLASELEKKHIEVTRRAV